MELQFKKISQYVTTSLSAGLKFLVEQEDGTYANVLGSDFASGSGGITGNALSGYVPVVATDTAGTINTLGQSKIYDTGSSMIIGNDGSRLLYLTSYAIGVGQSSIDILPSGLFVGRKNGATKYGLDFFGQEAVFNTASMATGIVVQGTNLSTLNDTTYGVLQSDGAGSYSWVNYGTVGTVSIATVNGFEGTSDGDPYNPTITLTTTVTGVLYGNGTSINAANSGNIITALGYTPVNVAGDTMLGNLNIGTSLSTPSLIGTSGQLAHTTVAQSSGAIIDFLFTPSAHTGQTASTNTPTFRIASATKTFATGALTAWYANHFQTQTIAFAGASTVTDAFGSYFENVTAGTNATATNNYSLGTNGFAKFGSGLSGMIIRNDVSSNNYCGLYNGSPTPSSSNYFIKSNGTTTLVNAATGGVLSLAFNGTGVVTINATSITNAQALILRAGTATAGTAPMYFSSGTNLTVVANGAFEFDGTDYFLSAQSTRQTIHKGKSGSVSSVLTAGTTITVTFGGTQPNATYKVNVTPTSALALGGYVNNKTTTTFDYVLPVTTGTVTFDYAIIQ